MWWRAAHLVNLNDNCENLSSPSCLFWTTNYGLRNQFSCIEHLYIHGHAICILDTDIVCTRQPKAVSEPTWPAAMDRDPVLKVRESRLCDYNSNILLSTLYSVLITCL